MSSSGDEVGSQWIVRQINRAVDSAIRNRIPDWIYNVGGRGVKLLKNPVTFILTVVIGYVVNTFIRPTFQAVVSAGAVIARIPLLVFLGGDLRWGPTGSIGLADAPWWAAVQLSAVAGVPVAAVFRTVQRFNESIAAMVATAGLAGFPIAAGLAVVEVGVVIYLLWATIQVIDIPVVELSGIVRVILAPIRLVVSFVR